MNRWIVVAALGVAQLALSGCQSECSGSLCADGSEGANGSENPGGENGGTPDGQTCADAARATVGLGGQPLKAGRIEGIAGADRIRSKPYAMLSTEFERTVGVVPASLKSLGATFGNAPARWYTEPTASAVTLSSTLGVAFDACLEYTKTDAAYGAAPEISTATAACTAMALKFWSRVAQPEDVQGCIDVAVTDSANETYATGTNGAPMSQPTTPRRRWAYACASILTASPFLTY